MESTIAITIHAPAAAIFALASRTEEWPRILPHYRQVRRLRGDDRRKVVTMAAWRDIIPVSWTAEQRSYPKELRIEFTHIRGVTRGMDVEWRITETERGTRVAIWHRFNSSLPLIGEIFARDIVGRIFIENIAGKTLRRIKLLAERQAASGNLAAGAAVDQP